MRRSEAEACLDPVWVVRALYCACLFFTHAQAAKSPPPPPKLKPPPPPNYCGQQPVCCNDPSNSATYASILNKTDPCPPLSNKFCNCTSEVWRVGQWPLLMPVSTRYTGINGGPFIDSILTQESCCQRCSSYNEGTNTDGTKNLQCAYWQHYVPQAPPNSKTCNATTCGYCIIYPPGSQPGGSSSGPTCAASTCTNPASSKYGQPFWYSTVGRGCPGGKNDPHFVGAQGIKFDFNGAPNKSFCLVTDPKFHVNMVMTGYYDKRTVGATLIKDGLAVRTWIKELGILWVDQEFGGRHSLKLTARVGKSAKRDEGYLEAIEVDGSSVSRMAVGDRLDFRGGLTLRFLGHEKQGGGFFDVDVYEVKIRHLTTIEVKLRSAHPLLQTETDAMVHINVRFFHLEHSERTHGVLGQTFRNGRNRRTLDFAALSRLLRRDISADGDEGRGFLDGRAQDYETSSVLAPDCHFASFQG